jgi:hypothetical protein
MKVFVRSTIFRAGILDLRPRIPFEDIAKVIYANSVAPVVSQWWS